MSGRFGKENTVVPYENADLSELVEEAISNIHAEITDYVVDEELSEEDTQRSTVRKYETSLIRLQTIKFTTVKIQE